MGTPYQRTVDAMLTGPILGMKYAAPVMKAQGSGSIITTASVAGTGAGYGPHVYSAVKAAVINLSRSVAQELGPAGIRVNSVSPGLIWRESLEESWPDGVSRYLKAAPLGRIGMPEDVADACLFLASPAARWITGSDLIVDGGVMTNRVY